MPLAAAFVVWLGAMQAGTAHPADDVDASCIRFIPAEQRRILTAGLLGSQTFAGLVRELCRTDVVAYVQVMPVNGARGSIAFVTSAPPVRYVRITLSLLAGVGADQVAVLGHELQHALDIARAPWVTGPDHMLMLERRLADGGDHSEAPVLVERRIRIELLSPDRWGNTEPVARQARLSRRK